MHVYACICVHMLVCACICELLVSIWLCIVVSAAPHGGWKVVKTSYRNGFLRRFGDRGRGCRAAWRLDCRKSQLSEFFFEFFGIGSAAAVPHGAWKLVKNSYGNLFSGHFGDKGARLPRRMAL